MSARKVLATQSDNCCGVAYGLSDITEQTEMAAARLSISRLRADSGQHWRSTTTVIRVCVEVVPAQTGLTDVVVVGDGFDIGFDVR